MRALEHQGMSGEFSGAGTRLLRLTRLKLNLYIRVLGRSGSRSIAVVCSVTLSTDPANH